MKSTRDGEDESGAVCCTTTIYVESCGDLHDLLPSSPTEAVIPSSPTLLPLVQDLANCLRKRSTATRSVGRSDSFEATSVCRRRSTTTAPEEFDAPSQASLTSCPPPTVLGTLQSQWLLLLPSAVILVLTIVVSFVAATPPPLAIAYLIAYALTSVASALWLAWCNAIQTKHFLTTLAERVPLVFTTPDAELSGDACVQYIQACVFNQTVDTIRSNARQEQQDPLAFMHDVIVSKAREVKDGYCLVDQTGTVLWCNEALAIHFGYADGSLVGQNVRVLMPEPYASQHDALLRNYGGASRSNIVGHRRRVPIVDRSGASSTALLGVEEYVDPSSPENYLFLGCMVFPDGSESEDPASVVQQRLDEGIRDVPQCCASLATHSSNLVVINARGIIQWVNDSTTLMLQYGFGELTGRNVSCLMGEEHAKQHDGFLAAYQERAASGTAQTSSGVVGRSRDLYAKTKSGELIRIFLSVKQVDRPSRQPQDCLFVGSLLVVQKQKKDDGSSSRCTRSEGTVRSSGGSVRSGAASSALSRIGALSALSCRKCTLVVLEVSGFNPADEAALHRDFSLVLNLATGLATKFKGVLHHPVGDRLFISLNLTLMNNAHRSNAGSLLHTAAQQWKFNAQQSHMRLHAVGASGTCVVGQFMSSSVMLSQLHDICSVLLRAANEMGQTHPLIDSALYEDLQFAFNCRPVNTLGMLDMDGKPQPPETIYELQNLKAVEDDEWMYQIAESGKQDEMLHHWRNCWASLGFDVSGPPNYTAALRHLNDHLAEHSDDTVGHWLLGVLEAGRAGEAFAVREVMGKLSYVLHYRRAAGKYAI